MDWLSGISQLPQVGPYPNLKHKLRWPNQTLQVLQMMTTSNGRRPQNNESGITHQPTVRYYPNLKHKLMSPNQPIQILQMKTTSNRRRPPITACNKDDLQWKTISKCLKRNILATKIGYCFKWRQSLIEGDLKMLKNGISQHPLIIS